MGVLFIQVGENMKEETNNMDIIEGLGNSKETEGAIKKQQGYIKKITGKERKKNKGTPKERV